MIRICSFILVAAIALTSCKKRQEQPPVSDAEQRKAIEDYARAKIPVLDRTIVQQEMQQFLQGLQASSNWPKDMVGAREELKRDLNFHKLFQKVEDGTYVILNKATPDGIVMYCTKETTVGYIAATASGEFVQLKKSDFDALAQQRR